MKNVYLLFSLLAIATASFAQTASVTFNLNMANEVVAESGVYLAGGADFGAPGDNPMLDDDGDGIYSITVEVNTPYTGNYTFTNGACGDWSCKENIEGQDCADGTWNDRLLSDVTEDLVISTCFAQCTTDGSCPTPAATSMITFQVDMSEYASTFGTVNLNGGFNGWCGGCAEMLDEDGDGVYSIAVALNQNETIEYKFTLDAWTNQENFNEGESCTSTIGGNTNRTLTVGDTDETLGVVCFNSCDACLGIEPGTAIVTWNLNMENEVVAESGVYVAGGDYFGAPGTHQMLDDDGDGVYSISLEIPTPFTGNYTFTNGNCGDWSCKENIEGQDCADGTWNDRLLSGIIEDTVISTCFSQCTTDGSCSAPPPVETTDVTFNIDMNYQDFPTADYDAVAVNGSWNGWQGWGVALTDDDADGIWTGTIALEIGLTYEYVVSTSGAADGYSGWGNTYNAGVECALAGTSNWFFTTSAEDTVINLCPSGCSETCSPVTDDPVNLTFNVDMNVAGANPAGIFVAGDFIAWDFTQMADEDGDGVFSYTQLVAANSTVQFKYMNGPGWDFVENVPAACGTAEFFNRSVEVGVEDIAVDAVCYASCVGCDTEVVQHEVTFMVNMANEEVAETGVYLAGGGFFGNPGDNQMMDDDGDGVYAISMMLDEGFSGHYTFTNGACGDWSCKENLAGQECGDEANYNDRFLPAIEGPTTINTCFAQCSTDGSCSSVSEASVTFLVDMSTSGVTGAVTIFGASLNGWNAGATPMTDEDGDGIYEFTTVLASGGHEFKYVNSGTEESLDPELTAECTLTTGPYTNRYITVEGGVDMVLEVVCFESCSACDTNEGDVYGCMDSTASNYNEAANLDDGSCLYSTTFNVDMSCAGIEFTTVYVTGPWCGWCAAEDYNFLSDDDGDGIHSLTIDLAGTIEYKYMVDGWAHQEDLVDDMQNGGECAPVTDFAGYANRLTDAGSTNNDAYGTCLTCDEVNPPAIVDVMFDIDMNGTGYPNADFDNVVVNGSWNGWGGWGVTLADADGDGVWSGTLALEEGAAFEFVIAVTGPLDGYSGWGSVFNAPAECSTNPEAPIGAGGGNYGATPAEGLVVAYCAGSCVATCPIFGCTDPFFAEFDLFATEDDGSCMTAVTFGCMYESAENYDAAANTDDGSCEFADDACPGDLDGDGLVATPDLLAFLSAFGTECD